MSLLKALSAKNVIAVTSKSNTNTTSTSTSAGAKQENKSTSITKTNTRTNTEGDQEIDPASRRSTFRNNLPKHHGDRNFRSLNFSHASKSCETKTVTVTSNRDIFPTRSIVNRALEVMSNSLKDGDCVAQKEDNYKDCSATDTESGDAESDSGKEEASTDDSDSDNNNNNNDESIKAPSTLTAQLSFRKIAKKRRKAGGKSSFHHSKSSKEYLRKAQEAYQKLKISEQENEKNSRLVLESSSGSNSNRSSKVDVNSNPCGCEDLDVSTKPEKDPDEVDYGYGDPVESKPQEAVDYGYGNPVESMPQEAVDYGYGDSNATQPQQPRRGGRARRRNSVTKFSVQAANIVAAKAATERILQLKPSLTSLLRGRSSTPTKHRRELNYERKRSSAKQNTEQRQEVGRRHEDQKNNVSPVPPQRSSSNSRIVFGNRDATKHSHSSESQERAESKQSQSQHEESSSSLQPASAPFNPHLKLASDYFLSDPEPSLLRKNSGRSNNISLRFKAPIRTDSWLSYDNSYSNNDDDADADSLAPDMESLCSIRDSSHRLDSSHSFRNTDLPPVPPTPQASPLTQASISTSRLTSPDHRTGFTAGRSTSGETSSGKSLVVSWSNGSNKDASLSRFAADRSASSERFSGTGNKFPIFPFPRNVTIPKSAVASTSCMPAPVNRTPSYNGSQQ